jgi:hypothetical protein
MFIVGFVGATNSLTKELTTSFPTSHFMEAMGIIVLQYLLQLNVENFAQHLALLKAITDKNECKLGTIFLNFITISI